MVPKNTAESAPAAANQFTAVDIAAILFARGWLNPDLPDERGAPGSELAAWMAEAAVLLGPHAASRDALADLLRLVFEYDAQAILRHPESHVVLAREGAREVIRELAHQVLEGPPVDSDRFKEIVSALKERLRHRGRKLFHPVRLALAGRAGEGELDRVILVLDCAAALPSCIVVKGTRQRMLEFCASME
jgi:hypothetical protein